MSLNNVFNYIDANSNTFIEEFRRYLKQPSISTQNTGMQEGAELTREILENVGIQSKIMSTKGYPVVFGEIKSKKKNAKTLLIYGHYDVQPPEPYEDWISPPFKAEIRDGNIYARGACDDKQLIVHIKAVESFLKTKGDIPLNLKFIIEGEEEIASPSLLEFALKNKKLLSADARIGFDGGVHYNGRPFIMMGMKGSLGIELSVKTAKNDLHSQHATIVENPAWKLIWILNTMKNKNDEILIDNWYEDVKKPTPEEIECLKELPFNEEEIKKEWGISNFINNLTDLELKKKWLFHPACTVTGFDAGYKGQGSKAVLPKEAFVKIDFRLVSNQKPEKCLKKLKDHLIKYGFNDTKLKVHGTLEPSKTPITSPIAKALIQGFREAWGSKPIMSPLVAGSGPGYIFTNVLGIPGGGAGCAHAYSNMHAPNEFMPISNFIKGIKASAAIMQKFSEIS